MKRSHVVNKMSDALLQFMPNVDLRLRKLIADVLLKEAEREGMLPPYSPQNLDHGSIMDCEWGPENEKK
jgi:hypothetical protein